MPLAHNDTIRFGGNKKANQSVTYKYDPRCWWWWWYTYKYDPRCFDESNSKSAVKIKIRMDHMILKILQYFDTLT